MNSIAVIVNDTTLRDGEQSAGVSFTPDEKLAIAQALADAGVPEMEIGIPIMGSAEQETIQAIVDLHLPARLMAWARMTREDLQALSACHVDIVNLSIPVSDLHIRHKLGRDRAWVLERIDSCVRSALDSGFDVCVGAEDASRADMGFLVSVAATAQHAGAQRLRFADTLGLLDPFTTYNHIARLRSAVDIDIEMHAHDDLGLANANTLAAVCAGATHINTTVNGLGERAGNAPLEEAVMALRHLYNIDTGIDTQRFPEISQLVARASGRPIAANKSIVGEAVFTHEAGIHVDGLLKHPLNYQSFDPAEVGRENRIVLGKHSGSGAVRQVYGRLGIVLSDAQAQDILLRIRQYTVQTKRAPETAELKRFLLESSACTHSLS